ncbi:MAG: DUF2871 domain-containing protein [Lachnospiraceae bacterium]|jgi:hypothetical protein|nr:DUF2871 domain-containing protein [Lachnospiraceae bacterium]
MEKHYANMALVYAVAAMVFGVFYREFTKFSHFTGVTNLSVMHTHYFLLGMFFFLVLLLTEKLFSFSGQNTGKILVVYHLGLNITGLGFLIRGLTQVWGSQLSAAIDASISGIAGIGHILTGTGILLLLLKIRKKVI